MRVVSCNLIVWCVVATVLMSAGFVCADTLYISSGGGNPVAYGNVKVLNVTSGQIVYTLSTGSDTHKPLADVVRMQLDDEPVLNSAEQAMADQKWDDAVDGYTKVARSTNKPWLKDWANVRLLAAAQKSKRFDAAASAYIATLLRDPESAAKYKPQMPDAGSTYLDGAIASTNSALNGSEITDHQKLALLNFLLDLERAKNDHAGEDRVAGLIDEVLAKDPSNPMAGQAIARRKLTNAQRALDAKDYAKAISEIESAKANFVEPAQQADALFILAEAKYALASAKKDPTELKDAALAYMRVVANFKDLPNHPHVPESLLKTAAIEQELNDSTAAQQLYQQIAQQYPDDPAAAVAKTRMTK